jgi:hypothetical protein
MVCRRVTARDEPPPSTTTQSNSPLPNWNESTVVVWRPSLMTYSETYPLSHSLLTPLIASPPTPRLPLNATSSYAHSTGGRGQRLRYILPHPLPCQKIPSQPNSYPMLTNQTSFASNHASSRRPYSSTHKIRIDEWKYCTDVLIRLWIPATSSCKSAPPLFTHWHEYGVDIIPIGISRTGTPHTLNPNIVTTLIDPRTDPPTNHIPIPISYPGCTYVCQCGLS